MEITDLDQFVNRTDFQQLDEQLNRAISLALLENIPAKDADALQGLVNFVDAFKDMLIDNYGYDECLICPSVSKTE